MQQVRTDFKALGGTCQILCYAQNLDEAREALQRAEHEARRIEQKFSRFLPESIVSRINSYASSQAVEVDDETAALLDFAQTCFEESSGKFDITSGALREAWDFTSGKLPGQKLVQEVLSRVGWQNVEWNRPFISFRKPGMQIDFGGFGKELAVDNAIKVLSHYKIKSALVDYSGDVRVLGPKPDGESWNVGIQHPRMAESIIAYVKVKVGALATSGDYERFMDIDGKRYCHILDPRTGWPVRDLQSVSVEDSSCLLAGARATISMLLGQAAGQEYLSACRVRHLMVTAHGEVLAHPPDLLRAN